MQNYTEMLVRLKGRDGAYSIVGNAHTSRGRFSVRSHDEELGVTVSRYDIAWADPSAQSWIEGFSAGQEPSISGYSDDLVGEAERISAEHFRRTGVEVRPTEEGVASVEASFKVGDDDAEATTVSRLSDALSTTLCGGGIGNSGELVVRSHGDIIIESGQGVDRFLRAALATHFSMKELPSGWALDENLTVSNHDNTRRCVVRVGSQQVDISGSFFDPEDGFDSGVACARRLIPILNGFGTDVKIVAGSSRYFRERKPVFFRADGAGGTELGGVALGVICTVPQSVAAHLAQSSSFKIGERVDSMSGNCSFLEFRNEDEVTRNWQSISSNLKSHGYDEFADLPFDGVEK